VANFIGILSLLALSTQLGCGSATGVVITIESAYAVPSEVDAISVEVSGGGQASKYYDIKLTGPFPQSLAVVADKVSGTLTIVVTAKLGAAQVTQSQIKADLSPNQMLDYIIAL